MKKILIGVILSTILISCSSTKKFFKKDESSFHEKKDSTGTHEKTSAADYFSNDQSVTITTEKAIGEAVTNPDSIHTTIDCSDTNTTVTKQGNITIKSKYNPKKKSFDIDVKKDAEKVPVNIDKTTIQKNNVQTGGKQLQTEKQKSNVSNEADSSKFHKEGGKEKHGASPWLVISFVGFGLLILVILALVIYKRYKNKIVNTAAEVVKEIV